MIPAQDIIVAAFYQFVPLPDYRELRGPLLALCRARKLRGTVLLAEEGINATVAGDREAIDALRDHLKADGRFNNLEYKESINTDFPFYRMKVKLKKEIVTLGIPGTDPGKRSGTRVPAHEWNRLISDPDVTVIDVRNGYECAIGTFENAVSPQTASFTQFPDYVRQALDPDKHRKIAMFCTGGIRCEKASAWMLSQGFDEVYQLQGGILRYLEQTAADDSLWQGECFVFDGRVAVAPSLARGEYVLCYSCRKPVSPADRQSSQYREGVSCPACHDDLTPERRARLEERQRQVQLAEARNRQHIGVSQENVQPDDNIN